MSRLAYLSKKPCRMGIRSLTYLDVPLKRRKESAGKALARIRERLNDPTTPPEQAEKLRVQMAAMEQWAADPEEK